VHEAHDRSADPLSALDFHVLLVLAAEDLYGYAIMKAVEAQSRGTVSPEIGSLYRVLARLMSAGLVVEKEPARDEELHRGRPRRYYRITTEGRSALHAEAERLRHVLAIANRVLPGLPR
jgi:DNA-binding PadR family transcriptional regulator